MQNRLDPLHDRTRDSEEPSQTTTPQYLLYILGHTQHLRNNADSTHLDMTTATDNI